MSAKKEQHGVTAADDRIEQLCHSCQELAWTLANTMPTSRAGVAAVLRYANEFEDRGEGRSTPVSGPIWRRQHSSAMG
jgi:hypothetical protein